MGFVSVASLQKGAFAMASIQSHRNQVATASGLDVLAGVWLLISPFALSFRHLHSTHVGYAMTNDVIFGIVIGILALIRFFSTDVRGTSWLSWVNAVLGVWVLISPWALRYSEFAVPMWNNIVLGIVVIVLACWSALASDTNSPTSSDDFNRPAV
jgi:hypothetical protein